MTLATLAQHFPATYSHCVAKEVVICIPISQEGRKEVMLICLIKITEILRANKADTERGPNALVIPKHTQGKHCPW